MAFCSEKRSNTTDVERRVRKKLDCRLLPMLCLLALAISLDTVSIGNARIMGLPGDLHLHHQDFNIAVMVFYIACVLFDVPANLAVQLSRPSWFLGGLAFVGGVVTICKAFTRNFGGLVACRFLLGVCQTAVQAGSILLLSSFYPRTRLHKRISALLACRLVANACGGLVAYGVAHLDGTAGIASWRWLFIVDGAFTCSAGILAVALVPQWPERVNFMTSKEKQVLLDSLKGDRHHDCDSRTRWCLLKEVLKEPKLYFGIVLQFCLTAISSSSALYLPTLLREFGWSRLKSLGLSAPVFLAALVVMLLTGAASDYKRLRYPFCASMLFVVIVAYSILVAREHTSVEVQYTACFFLISGAFAAHATALVWLSNNFEGRERRGLALGIVATFGNCGFLLGSNVYVEDESPLYPTGFGICLGLGVLALMTASAQMVYFMSDNKRKISQDSEADLSETESVPVGRRVRHVY